MPRVLDITGNISDQGYPDADRHWDLSASVGMTKHLATDPLCERAQLRAFAVANNFMNPDAWVERVLAAKQKARDHG